MIYFDQASTTAMTARALHEYITVSEELFGNPQGNHSISRRALYRLDDYRERAAALLGCAPSEIFFTSGATESNNILILGAAKPNKIPACSAVEHKAVYSPTKARNGILVKVDELGRIDQDYFREILKANKDTLDVVSIMTVNNETGVIFPVDVFAGMVTKHAPGVVFHTDAVQAPQIMDLKKIVASVHALSLSAHKFNGPKGTGLLYKDKTVKLVPTYLGGSQENEIRPGTQNLASIGAMVVALEDSIANMAVTVDHLEQLKSRFEHQLMHWLPQAKIQGLDALRSPAITNVLLPGTISEEMLFLLDSEGLCASGGAACASGALGSSHVIIAMGVEERLAKSALRFSFSGSNTFEEVDASMDIIVKCYEKLVSRSTTQKQY